MLVRVQASWWMCSVFVLFFYYPAILSPCQVFTTTTSLLCQLSLFPGRFQFILVATGRPLEEQRNVSTYGTHGEIRVLRSVCTQWNRCTFIIQVLCGKQLCMAGRQVRKKRGSSCEGSLEKWRSAVRKGILIWMKLGEASSGIPCRTCVSVHHWWDKTNTLALWHVDEIHYNATQRELVEDVCGSF